MGLDKYVISLLVFSTFFIGGVLLIGDFNNNYDDVSISTNNFNNISNATSGISEIYDLSTGMKEDVYGGEITEDNTENTMFKGAFSAIRLVSQSFDLLGEIIDSAAKEIGIPEIFVTVAMAASLIFVVFSLIFLVLRFRG